MFSPFAFSLFLSVESLHHCLKQKPEWGVGGMPKARATFWSQRHSSGNSPSPAHPGWALCQESTPRPPGMQLGLKGMLKSAHLAYHPPLPVSILSMDERERITNTANCQKLFVASVSVYFSAG